MSLSRRTRIAALTGGVVVLMAATGGITYATTAASTATNDYAIGCSSAHHALRLINSDGSCPTNYSRINLASAPSSVLLETTSTTAQTKTITIKGIVIQAICGAGEQSAVLLSTTDGNSDYEVHGSAYLGGTNSLLTVEYDDGTHNVNGPAATQISYDQPSDTTLLNSEITDSSGELTADLLVVHLGHAFGLRLYERQASDSCAVEAQEVQGT